MSQNWYGNTDLHLSIPETNTIEKKLNQQKMILFLALF